VRSVICAGAYESQSTGSIVETRRAQCLKNDAVARNKGGIAVTIDDNCFNMPIVEATSGIRSYFGDSVGRTRRKPTFSPNRNAVLREVAVHVSSHCDGYQCVAGKVWPLG
jgi:hypothetical protein